MASVNAVILNKDSLNYDILFKKISQYIKLSLKISNVQDIYEVQDLNSITDEMLMSDYIIVINEIAPEIIEYDKLIAHIQATSADISYFSVISHDHEESCNSDCEHSLSNVDIFILSTSNFRKGKISDLKQDNVIISDVTIVNDLIDVVSLNEDFKYQINFNYLKLGVYIVDPNNTYISTNIKIGKNTTILPNTIIRGNTIIGENCILGPNSVIENMIIGNNVKVNNSQVFDSSIGDKTSVGPFAYIRPQSNIGSDVKIGDFVEIKKATIGDGTKVSHLTYIGDATVGKNVNFGCGTVVVNYDGFTKSQTVVCDNAFIGCNTNLVSPVTVNQGAITAAGSTITSDIPANALAISRVKQENKPLWAQKFRSLKSKK